ncbi:hypothetical protein BDU57DRAFT_97247 [Ampelomyces quisqualis]|uniref:EthD domain-containing protein n=1 Tax=Ampelomyces quisqualis TaxID=50730 RepID=A0A6A5Q9X4_AMPQU|nr:hypothetical protein BDU57DRAFT_97247 [Ampelomyces quisqualis]
MTFSVIMLVTRLPGLTFEQFKNHYENKHVPLVMSILKDILPISHTRHYVKRIDGAPTVFAGDAGTVDYDCICRVELRDEAHFVKFNEAIAKSSRKAEIAADQEAFADSSKFRVIAIDSTVVTVP